MSIEERELAAIQNYRRKTNLDDITAVLGDAATGQVDDSNRPGKVYVMMKTSNGLSIRKSVWAPSRYIKAGTIVHLEYRKDGELGVADPDTKGELSRGVNPAAVAIRENSDSTPQGALETLRLIAKGAMLVSLKGWNIIEHGVYTEFAYPDIDLTSHVPSAGEMRYAMIAVGSDLDSVEVIDSTPVSTADLPLGKADVQECLDAMTAGSTATWALKLIGGQTEILQAQIDGDLSTKDLRQTVNAKGIYGYTPSGTVDTAGATGDFAWDDSYLYIKTSVGWKRTALSTF